MMEEKPDYIDPPETKEAMESPARPQFRHPRDAIGWNPWPVSDESLSRGLMQPLPPMDLSRFSDMTIREIIRECTEDSHTFFPDQADNLFFQAASACGEAGEMVNEAKKAFRSVDANTPEQRKKLEEESIDVFIYLCCVWGILGTNVSEVYRAKRERNVERFGGAAPTS
jgi:hypothetical protein